MRIIVLFLAFLLSACVATPDLDTNNKRLLAAETAIQELSLFALNSKDRMSADTRSEVKRLINDAHSALKAARTALAIGNGVDFSTNLSAANSLIGALRPILLELESGGQTQWQSPTLYSHSTWLLQPSTLRPAYKPPLVRPSLKAATFLTTNWLRPLNEPMSLSIA